MSRKLQWARTTLRGNGADREGISNRQLKTNKKNKTKVPMFCHLKRNWTVLSWRTAAGEGNCSDCSFVGLGGCRNETKL